MDSSAVLAIVFGEPQAQDCGQALDEAAELLMSAATLAELLIVAGQRSVLEEVETLVEGLAFDIISVDQSRAVAAAAAYRRWGRGNHPARLNYGDCFSYALAMERRCPLLFVGNDFAQTDVRAAIQADR